MTNQALWTIMVYISGDNVLDNFAIESLKKLRDGAGYGVTVEFLFDPNQENEPQRENSYDGTQPMNASLFRELKNERTASQKGAPGVAPVNMAAPKTLKDFIDSVIPRTDALNDANRHYGLILWGHGPELLFDAEQPPKNKSGAEPDGKYLTPAKLGLALREAKPPVGERPKVGLNPGEKATESSSKFDFIAFDACSMSMVEVAAELQEYAEFMIASQDDVPDQSFPYDKILPLFWKGGDARDSCTKIPQEYKNAFRDYFPAPGPVINITLSCLNLQNIDKFTGLLRELSTELQRLAYASGDARKAIIRARSVSRDFVLGLYVDIYDFCQKLQAEENLDTDLKSICEKICIGLRDKGDLVLDNQTNEQKNMQCHGLSIYLPYFTDEESEQIKESLTTTIGGGAGIGNQMSQMSKGGSTTNLHKSRAARIKETEKDLASLTRFKEWSNFIKCTWSYILEKEEPLKLKQHYSAEQCKLNLSSCEASSKSSGVAA
jgi:hypothetical protein